MNSEEIGNLVQAYAPLIYTCGTVVASGILSGTIYAMHRLSVAGKTEREAFNSDPETIRAKGEVERARMEDIRKTLADPSFKALLERRASVAREFMDSDLCEDSYDLCAHVDSVCGELPDFLNK